MSTELTLKGIAFCAVAMGISFGLCTASMAVGATTFSTIAAGGFLISFLGLVVCVIWLIIAAIVNSIAKFTE